MRKRIASVLMGICVTAFVCSAGSAIYFAQADDATAQPVLTMQEGASIRNFNPVGIRFITKISKEDYTEITAADENAIFGTLILPKEILGDQALTLENSETLNAVNIVAEHWREDTETAKSFTGVLVGIENPDGSYSDFPAEFYGEDLYAVSYCSYGENVIYAGNPQTYSIAYIASALSAAGKNDPLYTEITDSVLGENFAFQEATVNLLAGETAQTALSHNLKALYTSSDDAVATVSETGEITAVAIGSATITATIGNKKAECAVTVVEEVKTLETRWTMELKGQTDDVVVAVKDISSEIKGDVKKVEIEGYNYYDGDTFLSTGTKDILKSANGDGTITLSPPYRYREGMGDTTVVVTTTQGVYTMPMSIYTLAISNADELDQFGSYTTQQWKTDGTWDGYFVLDGDIDYTGRSFNSFIALESKGNGAPWDELEYKGTKITKTNIGFVGMFDGRGHIISNFKLAALEGNRRGGLIGALNKSGNGRGTIQNLTLLHADNGSSWGGMICAAAKEGVLRNIYVQADTFTTNTFFSIEAYGLQEVIMENIVIDVTGASADWNWAFGQIWQWGVKNEGHYLKNIYTIDPSKGDAGNAFLETGFGSDSWIGGDTRDASAPQSTFVNSAKLGEYLAKNNLTVSAANGWDTEFWTTDSHGSPIPKRVDDPSKILGGIQLTYLR